MMRFDHTEVSPSPHWIDARVLEQMSADESARKNELHGDIISMERADLGQTFVPRRQMENFYLHA